MYSKVAERSCCLCNLKAGDCCNQDKSVFLGEGNREATQQTLERNFETDRLGRNILVSPFLPVSSLCSVWSNPAGSQLTRKQPREQLYREEGRRKTYNASEGAQAKGQHNIVHGDPIATSNFLCPELNSSSSPFCLLFLCASATHKINAYLHHNFHILSLFLDLNLPISLPVSSINPNNSQTRAMVSQHLAESLASKI